MWPWGWVDIAVCRRLSLMSRHFRSHWLKCPCLVLSYLLPFGFSSAAGPIMFSEDPFFAAYDACKSLGSGTFGDVMLVRRRKTSTYFAAKFIDPKARKYGSDSKELQLLGQIDHECVVKMTDAFEPYLPASPRECKGQSQPRSKHAARRETVIVFPAFDMDLKWLMRLRAA